MHANRVLMCCGHILARKKSVEDFGVYLYKSYIFISVVKQKQILCKSRATHTMDTKNLYILAEINPEWI